MKMEEKASSKANDTDSMQSESIESIAKMLVENGNEIWKATKKRRTTGKTATMEACE